VVDNIKISSIAVLSAFVVTKFIITYKYLIEKSISNKNIINNVFIIALIVLIVSPVYLPQLILFNRFYMGSFASNIWHNSTIIAVMPFVVLLFWQTCHQLKFWSISRLYFIMALILLNVLIKPSYVFVYIIATPVVAFIQNKYVIKSLFLSLFSSILISISYYYQYLKRDQYDDNIVTINPFLVYMNLHGLNNSIILTILLFMLSAFFSFLLPIYILRKKNIMEVSLLFSTISMVVALLIAILFVENGSRLNHGNFFWQIYAAAFVFFLATIAEVLPELFQKPRLRYWKYGIKWYQPNMFQILLCFHFVFGCLYISKLIITQNYS
jgi:hypothetical protein